MYDLLMTLHLHVFINDKLLCIKHQLVLNVLCNQLCESQEEIRRISNVSQTGMMEDFVRRERPCIVTDSMEDWHIMNTDQFWFDNITEVLTNSV